MPSVYYMFNTLLNIQPISTTIIAILSDTWYVSAEWNMIRVRTGHACLIVRTPDGDEL